MSNILGFPLIRRTLIFTGVLACCYAVAVMSQDGTRPAFELAQEGVFIEAPALEARAADHWFDEKFGQTYIATGSFKVENGLLEKADQLQNAEEGVSHAQRIAAAILDFLVPSAQAATEGSSNNFFGSGAGANNGGDNDNSFFGGNAGNQNTNGFRNSFFGYGAGEFNTTGYANSFFGWSAGVSNTTGFANSFFGEGAGRDNTEGAFNSFFGTAAGIVNTTGNDNSFFGVDAGVDNTTGSLNSFFGRSAGAVNTTGSLNSFFGFHAGFNNTASGNSFFGVDAGLFNTTGSSNSFFGNNAGESNTTASNNSFFGSSAGADNTTGSSNSFFGRYAGSENTTGVSNSFFGASAGQFNSTASFNAFFGTDAGLFNSGFSNSFFGRNAGVSNTTGGDNAFFGHSAGLSNTSEEANTFIGAESNGAAGITNATVLGFRAQVEQSNAMVLGSIPGINFGVDYVDVGIGTTMPGAPLHIFRDDGTLEFMFLESNAAGGAQDRAMMQLSNNGGIRFQFDNTLTGSAWRFQAGTGNQDNFEITKVGTGVLEMRLDGTGNLTIQGTLTQNSDVNAKQDIEATDGHLILAKLDALPVAEWTYKRDTSGARHLGPMAQDFHAAFGLGEDETKIAPGDMAGVNMAAIKAQQQKIVALEKANAEKQAELAELKNRLARLEALMRKNSSNVSTAGL